MHSSNHFSIFQVWNIFWWTFPMNQRQEIRKTFIFWNKWNNVSCFLKLYEPWDIIHTIQVILLHQLLQHALRLQLSNLNFWMTYNDKTVISLAYNCTTNSFGFFFLSKVGNLFHNNLGQSIILCCKLPNCRTLRNSCG